MTALPSGPSTHPPSPAQPDGPLAPPAFGSPVPGPEKEAPHDSVPRPSLSVPAGTADPASTAEGVGGLRALLRSAVAELPGLPEATARERYGVRNLTVLWLEADKSEHTRRAYYADLADWLGWCERTGIDPLAARRADVDAWKGTFTVTGADGAPRTPAAATVARRLAGISSWYRYLVSNEEADRNPVDAVRRPRTGDAPPLPALDQESTLALLACATDRAWRNASEASWRDAALVHLLFHTGLRVSALTTAQVSDLDRDGRHDILRFWKKGRTRDFVPLPPAALLPLRHYLDVRARRLHCSPAALTGPLLATVPQPKHPTQPGGSPLAQRDVWRTLRTLARQAGIAQADSITPHTARRTAGTLLLAHGVPVQMVADLLGHRDIRITRDRYDAHRHKLDTSPAYTLAEILTPPPATPGG
jgi:integrase/recombinase XerD